MTPLRHESMSQPHEHLLDVVTRPITATGHEQLLLNTTTAKRQLVQQRRHNPTTILLCLCLLNWLQHVNRLTDPAGQAYVCYTRFNRAIAIFPRKHSVLLVLPSWNIAHIPWIKLLIARDIENMTDSRWSTRSRLLSENANGMAAAIAKSCQ